MKAILKNHRIVLAFMLLFCFKGEMGFGQEWEKVYKETPLGEIVQSKDSSYWVKDLSKDDYSLIKLDKKGTQMLTKKLPLEIFSNLYPTSDNGLLYTTQDILSGYLNKIDQKGNTIWTSLISQLNWDGITCSELPNKSIICANDDTLYLFNQSGKLSLKKTYSSLYLRKIQQVTNNSFTIVGYTYDSLNMGNNIEKLVALEYDYNLNLKKNTLIYSNGMFNPPDNLFIARASDGAYFMPFYESDNTGIVLKKFQNGNVAWSKNIIKNISNLYLYEFSEIKIDDKNNIIIIGQEHSESIFESNSNAIIWIFDENGNFKSLERFSGIGKNYFTNVTISNDGYYVACGVKNEKTGIVLGPGFYPDGFLVKTKAQGLNSFISGKIAIEKNTNCKADSLEQKLSGVVVRSEDTKKVQSYGVSDADGNYWLIAPSGTNTLKVQNPSPYFQQICDSTVQVQNGQTVEKDLLLKATVDCPYMSVEMSMQGIRPCSTAIYVVKYCNKGAAVAKNAFVKVKLDANLTYKTATKTGILQTDRTYLFALGDVAIDKCGVFTITSDVKCDLTLVGKTLCNKAHIYPDSICIGGNNIAKIQVTGTCNAGKVDFLIKNIGKNPMPSNKNYFVIEDLVMYKQGNFNLTPNATLPITIDAKAGKTYRLIADQTDLSLGTIATAAIEACVNNPNGNSMGFINQFSLGDESPFEDEDCRTVVNSFDPNDKTGFPIGTKMQHFIPKNTEIDYLIRFQNSGTDTAFVVVVKDTLSAFLDPATIVTGASSHPYRFTLTDKGVASFIFEKINLPHEKVNKDGSNGFVKFKIKQRANNPNGTVINNRAAIFFDFNLPIITNTTTHTIGENWITILTTGSEDVKNNLLTLKIYPNPFQENARIEIEENQYNNLIFNVLDLNGKMIRSEKFNGNSLDFDRKNLTQGFYMYQVTSEAKVLQTGKVVIN